MGQSLSRAKELTTSEETRPGLRLRARMNEKRKAGANNRAD